MRRLAILDECAKNIGLRMDKAAAELEMIQSSIETLRQEKLKTQKLEDRHIDQVEGCTYSHARLPDCSSIALGHDSYNFWELTWLDMQAATCKFSESFKIRAQGHGCVYKGEIMNRSVMIHKLHSHSIQRLIQSQQEVHPLTLLLTLVAFDTLVISQYGVMKPQKAICSHGHY